MPVILFAVSILQFVSYGAAEDCGLPLGMTTGEIGDSQISVSSWHNNDLDKKSARLRTYVGLTSWSAHPPLTLSQYLQVDFYQPTTVTAVATQGRASLDQWVTLYRILYSDGGSWSTYQESGQIKEFLGNADRETVVKNAFVPPIRARLIRINPRAWFGWLSMRVEFYGCPSDCSFPLGLSYGGIDTTKVHASSSADEQHDERGAGLNTYDNGARAWCALQNNVDQFLQIDLGAPTKVTAVATQGRNDYPQWVTSYQLGYSSDGSNFERYTVRGFAKTFSGNRDRDSVVKNTLSVPITARYIRINPRSWHTHISMRVELFGCPQSCNYPLGLSTGAIDGAHIFTSTHYDGLHVGGFSRLHTIGGATAWCVRHNNVYQWLQVDLGTTHLVTAIATQGRQNLRDFWVTAYHLYYSTDGHDWKPVTDTNGYTAKLFQGNKDRTSVVRNVLAKPVVAKHLRINPRVWHGHICMRAEFYGCPK